MLCIDVIVTVIVDVVDVHGGFLSAVCMPTTLFPQRLPVTNDVEYLFRFGALGTYHWQTWRYGMSFAFRDTQIQSPLVEYCEALVIQDASVQEQALRVGTNGVTRASKRVYTFRSQLWIRLRM